MTKKLIADVSKHQGRIDFQRMKSAGVCAVIIRAGYRTASAGKIEMDERYPDNLKKAEAAGLPIGAYWWTTAMSTAESRAEAEAFVRLVRGHKLGFPLWLDLEYYAKREGRADHLSATARTKYALAFVKRCSELGYDCGVYCNPDFWQDALVPRQLEHLPRWIAHYGQSAGMDCDIWQFTSIADGHKYGCDWHCVDLSYMYTDFPAGETSKFQTSGEQYPEPTITVTSDARAKERGLSKWCSSGPEVRWVQVRLERLGYDLGAAGVDGKCGTKTVEAIEQFQFDFWLDVDGLCGLKTVAELRDAERVNYRERVAERAAEIYPLCVGKTHSGAHVGKVDCLAALKQYKALSCNRMVSITLQQAGLLPKGAIIAHTAKADGKKKITDAVTGTEKLRSCKVYWVNKLYQDLPDQWKRAGCVYIQNSNACISAGGGKIWSCNKSKGYKYKDKGDYLRTGGYPFTSQILAVIVPRG